MTATEEPTLYDVLEVDPSSSLEELRAAVDRARETYGPESLAVYALVEEGQIDELRAKLDEAAAVLLDPARRASYDRSIGRIGPATLWAEDDDEDEGTLPPMQPGPHDRAAELELEVAPADDADEEAPRQQALALEVSEAPGPFGRGEDAAPAAPLLSGDWAAAVPPEQQTPPRAAAPERVPEPRPVEAEIDAAAPAGPESGTPAPDAFAGEEFAAEPSALPPALGLRVRPAAPAAAAPEPPLPPASPPPAAAAPERPPELPSRPRENRLKLDLPADAEFNGELLRRVRESYGLSLQQVAERTRITRIHLENVEADRYDRLPATVYLRGILVNLARELRLDPARVSKTYLLAAQRSSHARAQ